MQVTINEFWLLMFGAYVVPCLLVWVVWKLNKKERLKFKDDRDKIFEWIKTFDERMKKNKHMIKLDKKTRESITTEIAQVASAHTTHHQRRLKKTMKEVLKEYEKDNPKKRSLGFIDLLFGATDDSDDEK